MYNYDDYEPTESELEYEYWRDRYEPTEEELEEYWQNQPIPKYNNNTCIIATKDLLPELFSEDRVTLPQEIMIASKNLIHELSLEDDDEHQQRWTTHLDKIYY